MMPKETDDLHISLRARIYINGTLAYGSGISALLQATRRLHSLHAASKELDMTYRKALQIVDRAEAVFGKKIIQKRIGGPKGGGSELTEFGEALVKQFSHFEEKLQTFAEESFARSISPMLLPEEGSLPKEASQG